MSSTPRLAGMQLNRGGPDEITRCCQSSTPNYHETQGDANWLIKDFNWRGSKECFLPAMKGWKNWHIVTVKAVQCSTKSWWEQIYSAVWKGNKICPTHEKKAIHTYENRNGNGFIFVTIYCTSERILSVLKQCVRNSHPSTHSYLRL